ncbi:hypothetical protein [Falsiroseomonas sp. E2-1-a20]|uniref:hypothetical protein n=1 Tax=Falsiroseomonas sp. E2-1-a20 TaxID=3239300 RepID=UPI003F3C11F2
MLEHSDCKVQLLESQIDAMRKIMTDLAQAFDEALLLLEQDAQETDHRAATDSAAAEGDAAAA